MVPPTSKYIFFGPSEYAKLHGPVILRVLTATASLAAGSRKRDYRNCTIENASSVRSLAPIDPPNRYCMHIPGLVDGG